MECNLDISKHHWTYSRTQHWQPTAARRKTNMWTLVDLILWLFWVFFHFKRYPLWQNPLINLNTDPSNVDFTGVKSVKCGNNYHFSNRSVTFLRTEWVISWANIYYWHNRSTHARQLNLFATSPFSKYPLVVTGLESSIVPQRIWVTRVSCGVSWVHEPLQWTFTLFPNDMIHL